MISSCSRLKAGHDIPPPIGGLPQPAIRIGREGRPGVGGPIDGPDHGVGTGCRPLATTDRGLDRIEVDGAAAVMADGGNRQPLGKNDA